MATTISLSGNFFKTVSDEVNYYAISTSGIAIIGKDNNQIKNYDNTYHTFLDIWTDKDQSWIYFATSGEGVWGLDKNFILAEPLRMKLGYRYSYPTLCSNLVYSIHGQGTSMVVGTSSGITYINRDTTRSYNSTDLKPVTKVHLTPSV